MSSVESLREFVSERLTAAAEEIFGVFKQTIVEYEEEIDRQRRLLDIVWKPQIQLHRIELPQQHVCKQEEEVPSNQQLCIQERNSSLDQEDPEPPQIKEEQEELCTSQEGEQLELKQETETFMWTPADEESDHSEDQTLNLNPDKTVIAAEKESDVHIPVNVVSEPNNVHQLLSHISHVAESQDLRGGERGDSGSTRDAEQEQKNHHHKSKNHINNGYNTTMSVIHCNTHTGERSLKCDTCGKDFKCESSLKKHLRIHTGERRFTCKTCGRAFRWSSELTVHVRNVHTQDGPYLCTTCGKRFISISSLKRHVIIHTGEKPYICKTCGKRFISNYALKRHVIIHTDERPYICKTCGKRFNNISALKRHMIIHIVEKPYICNTCGKAFGHNSQLTVHMKRVHTVEKP